MALLKELQNAPHEIKIRWVVALSVLAFAIVVIVWLSALPAMVAIAPPATAENPNPRPELSGAASIYSIFDRR